MRIPDELTPLVRELAEAHLERLAGDVRIMKSVRESEHPDLTEAHRRLHYAKRLAVLFNSRKVAA